MLALVQSNEMIYNMLIYAGELLLRVFPIIAAAVFLAEFARIMLGEERLKSMLMGRSSWTARLRAAALGAVLPFCECGAFPVMLGLIRAGVPSGAVLTFFLVSPVVSMPAFMILIGLFGLPLAGFYLVITVGLGILGGIVLEQVGFRKGIFLEGIALKSEKVGASSLSTACGASCREMEGSALAPDIKNRTSCCEANGTNFETSDLRTRLKTAYLQARDHTVRLLKKILPYMVAVIAASTLLRNLVPQEQIQDLLAGKAPFDIIIAALAGIPIYAGDCSMIALAVPLIGATGALGAGIAFVISGSGTSISGIIFMLSIFRKLFIVFYVLAVFLIAIVTGYLISLLPLFGLI